MVSLDTVKVKVVLKEILRIYKICWLYEGIQKNVHVGVKDCNLFNKWKIEFYVLELKCPYIRHYLVVKVGLSRLKYAYKIENYFIYLNDFIKTCSKNK